MEIKMLSAISFSFLLSGCVLISTNSPKENITMPKMFDSIELTVQTDKTTYHFKEPVTLNLTVTNKGTEPKNIIFSSPHIYDFVLKKEGKEVWRWSNGKMFASMLFSMTFEPNKPVIYEETWTQKNNGDVFVQPGKYEVIGMLKTQPDSECLPVTIEIEEE